MLNDVIKFKVHIQGSLEAYEEFIAQEVEREFEERREDVDGHGDEERREGDGGMDIDADGEVFED